MRIERWYYLLVFCLLSLAIHVVALLNSRALGAPPQLVRAHEVEVTLMPMAKPPYPAIEPAPETPTPASRPPALSAASLRDQKLLKRLLRASNAGGPLKPYAIARAGATGGTVIRPLPPGLPYGIRNAGRPQKVARLRLLPGGGGSPAPGGIRGGKGGARGPVSPPEDILFSGGGAGGADLPRAAPRIGGGGGRSIVSVSRPSAVELLGEERPGLGPGIGGGDGAGSGGGAGYAKGAGAGAHRAGLKALASLRSSRGQGIGAGAGVEIGTRAPGGGKGVGAELPGTGGAGIGYGRGSGEGAGNGSGVGAGDGDGSGAGLTRGVPFGDIAGLLRGAGGGSGLRGAVFGAGSVGRDSADAPVCMVYLLDVSLSMEDGDKIGKAKEALKEALSELKVGDSFNVVTFFGDVIAFSEGMTPVTRASIDAARLFVDFTQLKEKTNLEKGLQTALSMQDVTHIFVLSDGEPTEGKTSTEELRALVRDHNPHKAQIISLALSLGEEFRGATLLQRLAEDTSGRFSYVNLKGRPSR